MERIWPQGDMAFSFYYSNVWEIKEAQVQRKVKLQKMKNDK